MSSSLVLSRAVLIAGLLVVGLTACGRRGALEAPPDASATASRDQADQTGAKDADNQGTLPSPVGTPRSKPNRSYTIPKQPFILDPLL